MDSDKNYLQRRVTKSPLTPGGTQQFESVWQSMYLLHSSEPSLRQAQEDSKSEKETVSGALAQNRP